MQFSYKAAHNMNYYGTVYWFSSQKSGEHFIDRLNKYLKEQE